MTSNTTRALKSLHDFFSDDTNRLYSLGRGSVARGRGGAVASPEGATLRRRRLQSKLHICRLLIVMFYNILETKDRPDAAESIGGGGGRVLHTHTAAHTGTVVEATL